MTARQLAKLWRANPADRLRIERYITVNGMWPLFSKRDGILYAKLDWDKITQSGGGAFKGNSDDRRFWAEMKDLEIVAAAGAGLVTAIPHPVHGYSIQDAA